MFAAESTPAPCGPPAIQLISFISIRPKKNIIDKMVARLTACSDVGTYTAFATGRFAAVWANTFAVINGITAFFADRYLLF
jgi:hypothetical protein